MNHYKIGSDMNSVKILWDVEPVMAWSPEVKFGNSDIETAVFFMSMLQTRVNNWSSLNKALELLSTKLKEADEGNYPYTFVHFVSDVYDHIADEDEQDSLEYGIPFPILGVSQDTPDSWGIIDIYPNRVSYR